ncbi:MAG: hypothetical protein GF317_02880 [Candidatus Lokiarchaeota archaeon]|nr:hypothetical protein [Candidatus Lokiarchaeota archaeon]MBD3198851.1 hypothetical protein [Candidatus Lokiarchaeota archaeon]
MKTYSKVIEKIELAEDYLLRKRNKEAETILDKLIIKTPNNYKVWLLSGITKRRLGKLKKAVYSFKKVVELDSSIEEGWGLLTITYCELKNVKKAKNTIIKASELNPSNERLEFYKDNLIRIYLNFGPFFLDYE